MPRLTKEAKKIIAENLELSAEKLMNKIEQETGVKYSRKAVYNNKKKEITQATQTTQKRERVIHNTDPDAFPEVFGVTPAEEVRADRGVFLTKAKYESLLSRIEELETKADQCPDPPYSSPGDYERETFETNNQRLLDKINVFESRLNKLYQAIDSGEVTLNDGLPTDLEIDAMKAKELEKALRELRDENPAFVIKAYGRPVDMKRYLKIAVKRKREYLGIITS